MTFTRLHTSVTHGLVGVAFAVVALSGELPAIVVVAFVGAWIASYIAPEAKRKAGWMSNAALLAALALLAVDGAQSGNWLVNALYFSLFTTALKLFQRHEARDYAQLYVLSFLLLLAGAVTNPGLSFALLFLVYTVLMTWALFLLHLRHDMEDRAAEMMAVMAKPLDGEQIEESEALAAVQRTEAPLLGRARKLVSTRFLIGTSALAVGIFAASIVVFFLFPRIGLGFFFAQGRNGQSMAGFSSRVELGHFGTIKDNPEVVARVELQGVTGAPEEPLRLRGISFDHYDGRMWSREVKLPARREMPRGPDGERLATAFRGTEWKTREVKQKIYLEPLSSDVRVLFGLPNVSKLWLSQGEEVQIGIKHRRYFQEEPSGDIVYTGRFEGGVVYEVLSEVPVGAPPASEYTGTAYPHLIRMAYLQLPELAPDILALAASMVEGATSPLGKARAIEAALRDGYAYTRDGNHDPDDPLRDFLLGKKAGHCEYFASAMVVLLRAEGVPARVVNGFLGGVWNPFGKYIEVRQGDAHAWVEVYVPELGWWTFDPTPPGGQLAPVDDSWLAVADRWVDSMKLQWYKWVVEYSLDKQIALLRDFGRGLVEGLRDVWPSRSSTFEPKDDGEQPSFSELLRGVDWRWVSAVAVSALALGVLLGLWLRRRAEEAGAPGSPRGDAARARRLWAKVLQGGRRRGMAVRDSTTGAELLAWSREQGDLPSDTVQRAVGAYHAVRFGGDPLTSERERALRAAAAALSRPPPPAGLSAAPSAAPSADGRP